MSSLSHGRRKVDGSAKGADFKKQLFRVYNDVNKDIYGSGVVELKISVNDDVIMFYTRHNRVQALRALEDRHTSLKQSVDYALYQEFKFRLGQQLRDRLGIFPKAILRDYDPGSLIAMTAVFLKDRLPEDG